MDQMIARPQLLKQANLSLIRKVLKSKETVTRAEIAWETKISSTTVRSLLTELQRNGEIVSVGLDQSSGGRKAQRYRFQTDRYFGAAFCITAGRIPYLVVNTRGEIVENGWLEAADGDANGAIIGFLDGLCARREIKAIGLGVPGVVDHGGYLVRDRDNRLRRIEAGESLLQRYGVPVLLENDLNAITIGFGRCYEKQFPRESGDNTNMAFLYFEQNCISAGFLVGGRIVRGWKNYAGEFSLIPEDGEASLSDCLSGPIDDERYTALVVKLITWICGILNPQYVALGGPAFRRDCLGPISDGLYSLLPHDMLAEILYSPDIWQDYYEGLAYLTTGKMFDEVQFVRE